MAAQQGKKNSTNAKKDSSKPEKNLLLRYAVPLLITAVLMVYLPTLRLGFTELDDSIFIKEQKAYNQDLSNLITSFKRGVFNPTEDVYYRPLLLNSFILNYQISGEDISGWHLVNVLLHLAAVLLLFYLLRKIGLNEVSTLLLTLFFAIHPVLSQAVAWIPGRNDTLLAIFTFGFLLSVFKYVEENKIGWLLLQGMLLLCALFTKETAVFTAPVAWVLLVLMKDQKVFSPRMWFMYVTWLAGGLIWFYIRSEATLKNEQLQAADMLTTLPTRLIVLIQYLGKILLPVKLSVFPILQDTSNVYGFVALALLAAVFFFTRNRNWKVIGAGMAVYLLFFIPALLVPASLNDQDFEHRTYLPMMGMLIVLSETVLLRNKLSQSVLLLCGLAVCVVLSIMNVNHQNNFKDPVTFWTAAVNTSPHSAYANMMLGARIDKVDRQRSEELIRKSYELDSTEKYINYYMGVMLQEHDSVLASESYFQKEIRKSDYYMCYFHLARVAFEKGDKLSAISQLETFLDRAPADPQANNNLLLLYLDTKQNDKARELVQRMKSFGMEVPPAIEQQLNAAASSPESEK